MRESFIHTPTRCPSSFPKTRCFFSCSSMRFCPGSSAFACASWGFQLCRFHVSRCRGETSSFVFFSRSSLVFFCPRLPGPFSFICSPPSGLSGRSIVGSFPPSSLSILSSWRFIAEFARPVWRIRMRLTSLVPDLIFSLSSFPLCFSDLISS